jgi:trans-aconitate methyltransferase
MSSIRERLSSWKWRARFRLSRALTRVGERLGSERLIYNEMVYERFANAARIAFPPFAEILRKEFPSVTTAVDLGCGTGHLVAAMRSRGVAIEGYEYAERPRQIARDELRITIHPFDLASPPALAPSDMVICIEVAEHVPPDLGDNLVQLLGTTAPLVVFTAATPGQTGLGHINEQPHSYWIVRFEDMGFEHDVETSNRIAEACKRSVPGSPWIAQNIMIFRRRLAG